MAPICTDWPAACENLIWITAVAPIKQCVLQVRQQRTIEMTEAVLTISSKNYSSWSLRGWLLCRMAGLDFVEQIVPVDDPTNRAELLLLSPSILVPCLMH